MGVVAGQKWANLRKVFEPQFTHSSIAHTSPTMYDEILLWASELPAQPHVKHATVQSFSIDAYDMAKILPFKQIATLCFGDCMQEMVHFDRLVALIDVHERIFAGAATNKLAKFGAYELMVWTRANTEMSYFKRSFERFCLDMVDVSRRSQCQSIVVDTFAQVEHGQITKEEWLQSEYPSARTAAEKQPSTRSSLRTSTSPRA